MTLAPDIALATLKLELIQWLTQVEDAEVLEQIQTLRKQQTQEPAEATPTPPYYEEKSSYTVADIQAIADKFPANKAWTYQDLQTYFPQNLKIKVEILNNQLLIMPSPSFIHQKISSDLSFEMKSFIRANKLGELLTAPMDVWFDDDNVEQPDILFIAVSRYEIIQENVIKGSPTLVVEIMSPANKKKERQAKHDLYEKHGVAEYWTIYPKKRTVKVEVLEEGKYKIFSEGKKKGTIQSAVLQGFEIKIEELMPDNLYEKQ
jgi:Uma2 family endonuclease